MRTLITRLRKYAAAVNHHLGDYRERLSREDLARIGHLLLPPLPKQFRYRYVPEAEQRAAAQRQRKAKTDVRQRVCNGHPGTHDGGAIHRWTASSTGIAQQLEAHRSRPSQHPGAIGV